MGGIDSGKRNAYRAVQFIGVDMRGTAHGSADFVDCSFVDAKLRKVNFDGSVFLRCTFAGKLDEVIFNHFSADKDPTLPLNEMEGVDFSGAELRSVEFRCLNMRHVKCPSDANQLVVPNYRGALDRALQALSKRSEMNARKLAAYLGIYRKWAGPEQETGLLFVPDLVEAGGLALVDEVVRILSEQPL